MAKKKLKNLNLRLIVLSYLIIIINIQCVELSGHQRFMSVYQKISQEKDLSTFFNLIQKNWQAKVNILYAEVTVFAPTNQAFNKYFSTFANNNNNNEEFTNTNTNASASANAINNETLLLYHIIQGTKMLTQLSANSPLKSVLENPSQKLWINTQNSRIRTNEREEYAYIYINNAQIIIDRSNYLAKNRADHNGREQVLHIIDEVLNPHLFLLPHHQQQQKKQEQDTSAYNFLLNLNYQSMSYTLEKFRKKVLDLRLGYLFKNSGNTNKNFTFLMPVDSPIYDIKYDMLDEEAIKGHIIPNHVLFTRSALKLFPYETKANGESPYIVFMMEEKQQENENNNEIYNVKSNTIYGDVSHQSGIVKAQILKANIPLENGVVHLINRPLVVMETLNKKFPYLPIYYKLSSDPNLNITYTLAALNSNNNNNLLDLLKAEKTERFTFFLPNDEAWNKIRNLDLNNEKLDYVLKRHLIVSNGSYTMQFLTEASSNSSTQLFLPTLNGHISLSFSQEENYYIQWKNNNKNKKIKVTRPNYECTNGIIHIVDDVFITEDEEKTLFEQEKKGILSSKRLIYNMWTFIKASNKML